MRNGPFRDRSDQLNGLGAKLFEVTLYPRIREDRNDPVALAMRTPNDQRSVKKHRRTTRPRQGGSGADPSRTMMPAPAGRYRRPTGILDLCRELQA